MNAAEAADQNDPIPDSEYRAIRPHLEFPNLPDQCTLREPESGIGVSCGRHKGSTDC